MDFFIVLITFISYFAIPGLVIVASSLLLFQGFNFHDNNKNVMKNLTLVVVGLILLLNFLAMNFLASNTGYSLLFFISVQPFMFIPLVVGVYLFIIYLQFNRIYFLIFSLAISTVFHLITYYLFVIKDPSDVPFWTLMTTLTLSLAAASSIVLLLLKRKIPFYIKTKKEKSLKLLTLGVILSIIIPAAIFMLKWQFFVQSTD